ncbi:MAG TPA: hypothetical protein VFZ65_05500, partial [Planctomycetota bacterium]|nr:hypothetical protein [Planctomycetota bacterium]
RAAGVEERFDVQPDGVELTWTFAARPAGDGDLVVRYAVHTSLGEPTAADGRLTFVGEYGGVHIDKVSGVDASGRRVDGSMQWDGSGVRFSLPAGFVDGAAYPIVLDPLIGASIALGTNGGSNTQPDAAYDATTDRWLVVWQRNFSATSHDPIAQLVTNAGVLSGPAFDLDPGTLSSLPRVANLGVRHRFGIVYTKSVTAPSTLHSVEFRTLDPVVFAIGSGAAVATTTTQPFASADIGAECQAPIGTQRGFVVAYEDGGTNAIRARRLFFDAADSLALLGTFSVWTGSAATTFTQPEISRAAAADGKFLVVAKQASGGGSSIVAATLDSGSNVVGATATVATSAANDLGMPDVDGFAGRFVVAYEAPGGNLVSGPGIRVRPVALDGTSNTLAVGSVGLSFGGLPTNQAFQPSVAYAAGRSWLGYRSVGALVGGGTQTTLRVAVVDSGSCAYCNESFVAATTLGGIAVSTMTSGGLANGESAISVASVFPSVRLQRLRDFGTAGTTQSLGGACGATGTVAFNHAPGIGSSGFRCTLSGLPPTALLPIFNFSPTTAPFPCGACVWTPFTVTLTPPIVAGTTFVEFPIPCLTTLAGQRFETQWTVVDFTQAPCPVLAGLAPSDRTLLTIGN